MTTPKDQPTGELPSDSGDSGTTERFRRALGQTGASEHRGDLIGPYTLISQIGEGGFGTVWKAERREPFRQIVALKLLHSTSRDFIARFEQERQMLATLNHPGIARILEGGITAAGRPWFAMEFVEGVAITRFCDEYRLSIADRLRLFIQLCQAVHHAHMSGIIHRDLKPLNVLVSRGEGDVPHVKVIDFGIAKALSGGMTDKTLHTLTERPMGTPEYMSPEQASPDGTRVDIRTDVYSLGVMLYELLSGTLPFEPAMLRERAEEEMKRIIREEDPPPPSARLSTVCSHDAARLQAIERARGVRMAELLKELRGELEWLPLKAMRKERERRYERPVDLARDIENYLAGRPLVAGPESRVYLTRKWMQRNRSAVRVVAIGALMLAVGASIPPLTKALEERRAFARLREFEEVQREPTERDVTDPAAREKIIEITRATGNPWKIRHAASGIVMLLVPPGDFVMGSPAGELGRGKDEDQHHRVIRQAFYLSQKEVSKAEWRMLTGMDAAGVFEGPDMPVESVVFGVGILDELDYEKATWNDIQRKFIAPTRGALRLPTEAEWEYACRAGTTTAYSFGSEVSTDQVNFNGERYHEDGHSRLIGEDRKKPVVCGSLPSNPWGFHEMHGNVAEWVQDCYAPYPAAGGTGQAVVVDGKTLRVIRGGDWSAFEGQCRSAARNYGDISPQSQSPCVGFRVARDAE